MKRKLENKFARTSTFVALMELHFSKYVLCGKMSLEDKSNEISFKEMAKNMTTWNAKFEGRQKLQAKLF